jgi:Zn-finger nucleic acid-binding protein
MKEFTRNWIQFFRNTQSDPQLLQDVFEYISSYTPGALLNFYDFKNKLNADDDNIWYILKRLADEQLIAFVLVCPHCDTNIALDSIINIQDIFECPYCHNVIPLKRENIFKVLEKGSYKSHILRKLEEETYELNAELLAKIGQSQHHLYYLLTDINKSEILQKSDNYEYNELLNFLWNKAWPNALRFSNKACLPLYARGDAVAILFADFNDLLRIIPKFIDEIKEKHLLKLKGYAQKINFSYDDRKNFVRSLDKRWDFNTSEITQLWRIAQSIDNKESDSILTMFFINYTAELVQKKYNIPIYTKQINVKHNEQLQIQYAIVQF